MLAVCRYVPFICKTITTICVAGVMAAQQLMDVQAEIMSGDVLIIEVDRHSLPLVGSYFLVKHVFLLALSGLSAV